jgi:hypothetical protein
MREFAEVSVPSLPSELGFRRGPGCCSHFTAPPRGRLRRARIYFRRSHQAGNLSLNIGRPLRDWSRVAKFSASESAPRPRSGRRFSVFRRLGNPGRGVYRIARQAWSIRKRGDPMQRSAFPLRCSKWSAKRKTSRAAWSRATEPAFEHHTVQSFCHLSSGQDSSFSDRP